MKCLRGSGCSAKLHLRVARGQNTPDLEGGRLGMGRVMFPLAGEGSGLCSLKKWRCYTGS